MAIPFLTPARAVLLIGDEALYVYNVTHSAVKLVDSIPWETDDFEDIVVGLIRKDCGGKPVLVLNDMTDQHFKGGQRLPRVGVMDKGRVLKRKLQVAFPNYPIRGAIPIQGKGGKDAKGAAGLYLFAAVPASEQIVKTLEAVRQSMVSIAGFVLLPVEASDMVRTMSEKIAGKGGRSSRWAVFIGQHHNGALRQVIVRDGQLAMTRMTPVSDSDSDAAAWAQEINQEFKATISYLSRFGYSSEESTDVIVIANRDAGEALEKLIDIPCNFHTFSASEAARMLGTSIGLQDDARYADPLHAAWAGRKAKFILPMDAADISRIHKPRQVVAAAVVLLLLAAGYLSWQLAAQAQSMVETRGDLTSQRTVLTQAESELQQEVARLDALGFDIELIQGTIETYESFEADRVRILSLVKNIGAALGQDLRLDNLAIRKLASLGRPPLAFGQQEDEGPEIARLGATLALSFPRSIDLELGIQEVLGLERRLRGLLPGYDVEITRQVGRREFSAGVQGEVGPTAEEIAADEDYLAEIEIRGPQP